MLPAPAPSTGVISPSHLPVQTEALTCLCRTPGCLLYLQREKEPQSLSQYNGPFSSEFYWFVHGTMPMGAWCCWGAGSPQLHHGRLELCLCPSALPCPQQQWGADPAHTCAPHCRNFLLLVKYWLRFVRTLTQLLRLSTSTQEAGEEGGGDRQQHQNNTKRATESKYRGQGCGHVPRAQLDLYLHKNKLVFTRCAVRKEERIKASKLK